MQQQQAAYFTFGWFFVRFVHQVCSLFLRSFVFILVFGFEDERDMIVKSARPVLCLAVEVEDKSDFKGCRVFSFVL